MLVELDKRLKELEGTVLEMTKRLAVLEVLREPHKARTRAFPTETGTAVSEEIIGPDGKLTSTEPVLSHDGKHITGLRTSFSTTQDREALVNGAGKILADRPARDTEKK